MGANSLAGVVGFLRLLRAYAQLDFMWVTRDFKQFASWYVADILTSVAGATAVFLLAQRFDGIGDWDQQQVLFMLGYGLMARGLLEMFFAFNMAFISRRIGRGQLDHSLLQPHPLWVNFLTEGFAPISGMGGLATGVAVTAYAASQLPVDVTPLWLGALGVNLIASAAIILTFSFLLGSLAFWAPAPAEEISMASMEVFGTLKSFPLDGASTLLLGSLLSFLPVGFTAWLPSRALAGIDNNLLGLIATPIAAVALAILTAWVFKKGLTHYGSTGSQRYSSFGFRR